MTDKSKFVLKLSGIDLETIKAGDIGRLLNDFCKLLGNDYLFFDAIYSGSTVLKVSTEPEYYNEKLDKLKVNIVKLTPALEDINKVLRSYSRSNSEIEALILASNTAVNDENMELVHQINFRKPITTTFSQNESIIGKLFGPSHSHKDENDAFTITLANGEDVSVIVSPEMSSQLSQHLPSLWNAKTLVKFTGKACYETQGKYKLSLKRFIAHSFEIVQSDTSAQSWMTEFISFGKSGWQEIDNPEDKWLEERHS